MGVRDRIYRAFTRKRFAEPVNFRDIQRAKKFVLVLPGTLPEAVDCLPGIAGLVKERRGIQLKLLVPEQWSSFFHNLDHHLIEKIFYRPPIKLFNRTFKDLKKRLAANVFDVMIDLGRLPNQALAYLMTARYRVRLGRAQYFPFYNMSLVTNDRLQIFALWSVAGRSADCLFPLDGERKKAIWAVFGKRHRPLLFVNGRKTKYVIDELRQKWPGTIALLGREVTASGEGWVAIEEPDERVIPLLTHCQAYLGPDDELGRLARACQRQIL